MVINFRPVGRGVLIERDSAEDKTPGGIILPDSSKEKPLMGTVISIGARAFESRHPNDPVLHPIEPEFKEGDKVYFRAHAAVDVKLGRKNMILVDVDAVLGVVERFDD